MQLILLSSLATLALAQYNHNTSARSLPGPLPSFAGDRFTDPARLHSTQSINRSRLDLATVLSEALPSPNPILRRPFPSLSSRSATVSLPTVPQQPTVSAPSYRSVHLPPTDPLVSRFSSAPSPPVPSTPPPVEALKQLTHAAYDFIISRLNELSPDATQTLLDTVAERSIGIGNDVIVEMQKEEPKTSVERSTDSAAAPSDTEPKVYPVVVEGGKGEAYLRNEDPVYAEADRLRAAAVDAFFRSLPVEPLRGFTPR